MRLAVFTSEFPARVSTFFARDVRVLLAAGFEVDVFPIRPVEPSLWPHVPLILGEDALPHDRVHSMSLAAGLRYGILPLPLGSAVRCGVASAAIGASAARFGGLPFGKSLYACFTGWAWAHRDGPPYDHVLAYWGNYAATAAYIFHRAQQSSAPFTLFLHAGADLYRDQVYLERKLLYADLIVTCTRFNRGYLRDLFPKSYGRFADRLHVYYHGLDFSEFPYRGPNRRSRTILGVGRLDENKGFDFLVRAIAELARSGTSATAEIIGEGRERSSLQRLASELGIADRVRFLGWKRFEEVRDRMAEASVLVQPSAGLGDGMPNVIKEAMAVGTPVIASSVAGIPEALDDGRCGMLVPPCDVGALAQAIRSLLENESLRWKYSEAARRHMENAFDLWRNGRKLAALIQEARRAPQRISAPRKSTTESKPAPFAAGERRSGGRPSVTTGTSRRMRLAVFTSQFPSRVSTFFARDMRGLIEAGAEIEIFPLHPLDERLWRYVPSILDRGVVSDERIHHVNLLSDLPLPRASSWRRAWRLARDTATFGLPAMAFGPAAIGKSGYAIAKAWLWAEKHGGRFDHVLAYWGNYAATAAIVFQRLSNPTIPVSMFLHAGTDLYRRPMLLRSKLLYVDNVFVVCDFNRSYIEGHYPDIRDRIRSKIHIHHPGLDLSSTPYSENGRQPGRLLGVGSFEKTKGFADLLYAVAGLRRRGTQVSVDLIGDGPQYGALRRLASSLGIESAVVFHGWLAFEDVQKAMRSAALLVHPSTGLGDAVPTVIKESMAVGTPVVASAIAGIPELLDEGRCGVLVPPRDPERLSEAIGELLADDARRLQFARAGRGFAEETFDLWRNGRRLAEILRSTSRKPAGERRQSERDVSELVREQIR